MSVIAFILAAQVAASPSPCGPAPEVISKFRTSHGETIRWMGRAQNGAAVLMSSRKGTWTILFMPNPEVACIIGSGKDSRELFGEPA